MNTGNGHINFKGISLNIEYQWDEIVVATYDQISEGGNYFITSISTKDSIINIYDLLSENIIREIEEQYLKNNEL